MSTSVSIFIPLWTGKTKEIKTGIKDLKRQIKTIPKDEYYYEGDFDKNKINGKGKLFYRGKLYYDGEWKNGEFSGKGILYQYIGNYKQYEGTFKRGFYDGEGILYDRESRNKKNTKEHLKRVNIMEKVGHFIIFLQRK